MQPTSLGDKLSTVSDDNNNLNAINQCTLDIADNLTMADGQEVNINSSDSLNLHVNSEVC